MDVFVGNALPEEKPFVHVDPYAPAHLGQCIARKGKVGALLHTIPVAHEKTLVRAKKVGTLAVKRIAAGQVPTPPEIRHLLTVAGPVDGIGYAPPNMAIVLKLTQRVLDIEIGKGNGFRVIGEQVFAVVLTVGVITLN